MVRRKWVWSALLVLPLAVAGAVFASSQARSYVCPITGEVLPCEKCCPLNQKGQEAQVQFYICPVTGEELPCEKCCPLSQGQ